MPKNEDGEFELVLGNSQLLSMFFVVVVLLGVFFVMGYIVGRNSAPLVSSEPSTTPQVRRQTAGRGLARSQASLRSRDQRRLRRRSLPSPWRRQSKSRAEPRPEPPNPEPTKPSTSKSEPAAPKREVAKAEKPRPAPAQSNAPIAGETYLQLVATTKHDADARWKCCARTIFPPSMPRFPRSRGCFACWWVRCAPGELNKVKVELQGKGFQGNAAIRRNVLGMDGLIQLQPCRPPPAGLAEKKRAATSNPSII